MQQHLEEAKVCSIIRIISSSISVIASSAIITLIARSQTKCTSPQHRLLLGLSIADLIASTAMSPASIPIPRGTPYTWMPLGTITTCEVQGFLFSIGAFVTPCYNAGLCLFYFCKIRYDMEDRTFSTKIEPFIHIVPILFATFVSTFALVNEYFNPAENFCFLADFPVDCTYDADVPCERGEGLYTSWMVILSSAIIFLVIPIVIFTSMITVTFTVYEQDKKMARYGRGSLTLEVENQDNDNDDFKDTRRVLLRALAYSGAWLITFIFPLFITINYLITNTSPSFVIMILNSAFHPLQGFLNFVVFLYPKICDARKTNPELSYYEAFCSALNYNREVHRRTTENDNF